MLDQIEGTSDRFSKIDFHIIAVHPAGSADVVYSTIDPTQELAIWYIYTYT